MNPPKKLNTESILDMVKLKYGQLVTLPEDFDLIKENVVEITQSAADEYSHFIPATKFVDMTIPSQGIRVPDEVVNVRNVRAYYGFYPKGSTRADRRAFTWDPMTRILSVPFSTPCTIEYAVRYLIERERVRYSPIRALKGDKTLTFKIYTPSEGSLKISIPGNEDKPIEFTNWVTSGNCSVSAGCGSTSCGCGSESTCGIDDSCGCGTPTSMGSSEASNLVSSDDGTAIFNTETRIVTLKDLDIQDDGPIMVEYNPLWPTLVGLDYRDRLFMNLAVGYCLTYLGNYKEQLVTEGDMISFTSDNLKEQGQKLIDDTINVLMNASTTYKAM